MKAKGINLENVKLNNRATVLSILNRRGAMSRKDLAAEMGLTAATITLICNELIEEGIIRELGEANQEEKRAGRKKILVDIDHNYKKVLCVSIEADVTYITLTDIGGAVLGERQIDTDDEVTPEVFLGKIAEICREISKKANVSQKDILAIGVTVPGKVDRENGLAENSYNVWSKPVEIKKFLEETLGISVIVENNVKAYAESELTYGNGRNVDNMLIVKWGPGVGSAIIIDGKIYQGATNQAAELGHTIAYVDGKHCSCGKRGCLETGISTGAISREVDEAVKVGKMPELKAWFADHHTDANSDIVAWGAVGDKELQLLWDEKIKALAFAVSNITCMLNPSKIVVYGCVFEIEGILEGFREQYGKYSLNVEDEYILPSNLQDKAYYSGPLALVTNEMIFKS